MYSLKETQPALGSVETRLLNPQQAKLWDEYVNAHPEGTFFHLSGWQTFYQSYFKLKTDYLMAFTDGMLTGVLPLAQLKSVLFSNALISTPFMVYGGILASDSQSFAKLLLAAKSLAKERQVDYLELRQQFNDVQEGYDQSQYVTFKRKLAKSDEENLSLIPRKQRAVVRKAIAKGLTYTIEKDVNHFYPLYAESLRNLGTPVMAKGYYQALLDHFGEQIDILTVMADNKPVASVMSFYHQQTVLPFYGGGGGQARGCGANDFMYWSLMQHAVAKGCRVFDFGRSKVDTGSYRFKKHWGFEQTPLHYRYLPIAKDEKPNFSPTNPKYQTMITTWKKLPLAVANTLGPFVARRIG